MGWRLFSLQIIYYALAGCKMNSKFSVPKSVPVASCSIENFSFIVHSARALFVNKTLTTVSNPLNTSTKNEKLCFY